MKSDAEIRGDIEAELHDRPHSDTEAITVRVEEGIALLGGCVCSYCEKYRIESAAKRVTGVAGVINDIEVRVATKEHLSDAELLCAAKGALETEVPAVFRQVEVLVQGGQITLTGSVPWLFLRERAESAVRRLRGVVVVHNEITLEAKALSDEIRRRIEALSHAGEIVRADDISVETHGGEVTLHGHVGSVAEGHLIERAAWSVHGVTRMVSDIEVRTATDVAMAASVATRERRPGEVEAR